MHGITPLRPFAKDLLCDLVHQSLIIMHSRIGLFCKHNKENIANNFMSDISHIHVHVLLQTFDHYLFVPSHLCSVTSEQPFSGLRMDYNDVIMTYR